MHGGEGEGAGALGLDVVDCGEEARGAEAVGPVVGFLSGEEGVAAGGGEVVECGGGFGTEDGERARRSGSWAWRRA